MGFARHYVMIAAAGQEEALRAALSVLAVRIAAIPGCDDARLMRDIDRPDRFVLMESWFSREAHAQSGPAMPKAELKAVMALLGEPPRSLSLAPA